MTERTTSVTASARMPISRRSLLAGAGAVGALAAFGGLPAFAAGERLRFLWWGSQERADRTNKALDAYRAANPDVTIDGEFAGWGDYWPRLATQVAGRNAPDLIQMDYRYLFEYARRGALLPLDEYVGGQLEIGDFGDNNINSGRVDGKLYGVNLGVNSSSVFYDIAAWEEAGAEAPKMGTSWEQFAANCEAFAKGNKRPKFYATSDASGVEPSFELWLRQQGKQLYTDAGIAFEPADAAAWFANWAEMRKSGGCVPADVQALDKLTIETGPLTLGYAATGFAHSNQFVGYQKVNKAKLGITAYPVTEGGQPGHYYKPSMMLSIASGTAAPEATVKLANFLVMNPEAVKILGVERGVPASASMQQAVMPTLDETSKAAVDYIAALEPYVGPLPPPPPQGAGEIQFVLQRISQEVAFEMSTPEAAGEQFATEAAAILKRA